MNIIFDNQEANVAYQALVAEIERWLDENGSVTRIEEFFALSGRAAAVMQLAATEPVQNVIVICQLDEAFVHLSNVVHTLLRNKGVVRLQTRIIIELDSVFLEIWNLPGSIIYNGDFDLYIHDVKDIPEYLLD